MFRNLWLSKVVVLSAFLALVSGAPLVRAQDKKPLTADEIMDRTAKAQWGDKYKGLTSYRDEAELILAAQGMKGTIVVSAKAPNKMHSAFEIPGVVKQEEGFDGTVAWGKDSMQGVHEKEGKELLQAKLDSWIHGDAEWREHYKKVTLKGDDTVDEKKVYVLEMEIEGLDPRTVKIDAETFLPVCAIMTTDTPQGKMEVETEFLEYKTIEGAAFGKITLPWKIRQSVAGQVMEIHMTKADCNVEIADSVFTMPKDEEEEEEGDDSMDDEGGGKKEGGK